MKKLTLEYIAGFVDGEGCFTIIKRSGASYQPRFSITNTNKQILEDIRKFFSITTKITLYKPKNPRWKIFYKLKADAINKCKSIATQLEPYLILKKEQAQILMQYPREDPTLRGCRSVGDLATRAHVQKLRNRMRILNKKGPTTKEVI